MTIAEVLDGRPPLGVRIFATDVDAAAVAFARRGVYPAGALASLPAALRNRYFAPSGTAFEVVRALRSRMIFGEHDLSAGVPFPRIDLILCRNVLIYLHAAAPAGRAGDVRLFIAARRAAGPGPLRDRHCIAGLV